MYIVRGHEVSQRFLLFSTTSNEIYFLTCRPLELFAVCQVIETSIMVTKTIAPYGTWTSPLTAEAVTAGSRSLSSPRADVSSLSHRHIKVSGH